VTTQARDDGFHEIQLNGKQLVFLFMAVTIVSVVIFLCGVLVGRGVRAERTSAAADASAVSPLTTPDAARSQPVAVPAGSDPTVAAPPPADDLTYFDRLEKKSTPAEHLKPASEKAAQVAVASEPGKPVRETPAPDKPSREVSAAAKSARAAAAAPPPAASAPASTAIPAAPTAEAPTSAPVAEPPGQGYALQITALREQTEADALARRLSAKGYSAYVLKPAAGTSPVFRVRVGKFKTRREAEAIASKLQQEEQFKPWITR
jgi:cell division septation protein DedD